MIYLILIYHTYISIYLLYYIYTYKIAISCKDTQVFGYRRGGEIRLERAALGELPGSSRGGGGGLLPAHGLLGRWVMGMIWG